jgi:seryl-tRNA synthetase
MSNGDAYIRKLKSLDEAIKRLNGQLRDLRLQKKSTQERLHTWMKRKNMEEYNEYKIEKIAPKLVPRKKASEKKQDAFRLFTSVGITDPETFWLEFKKTQTAPKD